MVHQVFGRPYGGTAAEDTRFSTGLFIGDFALCTLVASYFEA